jgi:hypothetical protein
MPLWLSVAISSFAKVPTLTTKIHHTACVGMAEGMADTAEIGVVAAQWGVADIQVLVGIPGGGCCL